MSPLRTIYLCAVSLAVTPAYLMGQADPGPTAGLWKSEGVGAVVAQGGSYRYDPNPQLPGLDGGAIWSLGLSFFPGPPFPSHTVGVDFHAWGVSRSFPSLVEGAADATTELTTRAFALGGRVGLPVRWPVGMSLLGGFTYIDHVMKVAGRPAWFLPGLDQTWEEEDAGWSAYWGLGTDVRFRSLAIGLEKRWVDTEGTFDDPFGLSDVDLGGAAVLVTASWYIGR